jgi:hypothetical protein
MLRKVLNTLSVVSTLAMLGWLLSDFFGGMVIYLIMLGWFLGIALIVYVLTLIITIVLTIKSGVEANKISFYTHLVGLFMIGLFALNSSEVLKSRKVLEASLEDDLNVIELILRKNGHFETISTGMFGVTDQISGKYIIRKDTIVFLSAPYDNDFIPTKVLIDRKDSAIFFKKDVHGEFSREKGFSVYFRIDKIDL